MRGLGPVDVFLVLLWRQIAVVAGDDVLHGWLRRRNRRDWTFGLLDVGVWWFGELGWRGGWDGVFRLFNRCDRAFGLRDVWVG